MWPWMTFEVTLYKIENLSFHNVSIYKNVHQKRSINEYSGKKKVKYQSPGTPEFFFMRYRRTYLFNNKR